MILTIWWWVFGVILAVIGGAMFCAGFYLLFSKLYESRLKKIMPKKREGMSDGGKAPELNIEEVKQDERRKLDKFREFEKLRRKPERRESEAKGIDRRPTGTGSYYEPISERGLLSDELDSSNQREHSNGRSNKRASQSRIQSTEESDI